MRNVWDSGPKGFYHRKCYQLYTIKENLQIVRKRTAEAKAKTDMTNRPAKLPWTYDKSKCVICLADRSSVKNRRKPKKLCQCLTDEAVQNMRSSATANEDHLLLKRLDADYDIFCHKYCFKKLLQRISSIDDNQSEGHIFDASFDKLTHEIDINMIKATNFVTLSELLFGFIQILKDDGIEAPNYKPSYLQNRLVKRFNSQICFWRSNKTSPCVVYSNSIPKGSIVQSAMSTCSSKVSSIAPDETSNEQSTRDVAIHIYCAAKAIRGSLLDCSSLVPWPADGDSISENKIDVPNLVYNCFARILTEGSSDGAILSSLRETLFESIHRRIISFAQDFIYSVSRGRNKTPKHVSLAVLLKGLTGSADAVNVVNKFGHCMSYDQLEELETASTANIVRVSENKSVCIPSNIKTGVFSSFCWDNNDLIEETLTSIGTTHCTNGIILQRECDWCENVSEKAELSVKRQRSLKKRKKPDTVESVSGLKPGSEIAYPRFKFNHHAICIDVNTDQNQYEIVHLTGDNNNSIMASISSNDKASIVRQWQEYKSPVLLYKYPPEVAKPAREVIATAKLLLRVGHGNDYHAIFFNCEHFASFCATGVAYSKQTLVNNFNEIATDVMRKKGRREKEEMERKRQAEIDANQQRDMKMEGVVEGELCDPCNVEGKSVKAVKHCTECSENLCRMCGGFHGRFKAFKSHHLTDVSS